MPRVLMTAFEPFGSWKANASWQAIVELTRNLPRSPTVVTRLYPVDFPVIRQKLREDLTGRFDYAIHLGQSHKSSEIQLERFGLNIGAHPDSAAAPFRLEDHGPAAYRSSLPLDRWAGELQQQGVPCSVSNYAGDYGCNAMLYWSRHFAQELQLPTLSTFLHVPVTPRQAADAKETPPSMDSMTVALALRWILDQIVEMGPVATESGTLA